MNKSILSGSLVSVFASLLLTSCTRSPQLPAPCSDFFPMGVGTCWEYTGRVKWTPENGGSAEADVTWEIKVLSRQSVGPFDVAIVRGFPSGLAWQAPESCKPVDYLVVRTGQGRYYRIEPFDAQKDGGLLSSAKLLTEACTEYRLFLFSGMRKGDTWAFDPYDAPRTDGWYQWHVEKETIAKTAGGAPVIQYTLAYRTNPDHTITDFAPGIGLVRYQYVHHGTVAECDLRLVNFSAGKPGTANSTIQPFRSPIRMAGSLPPGS